MKKNIELINLWIYFNSTVKEIVKKVKTRIEVAFYPSDIRKIKPIFIVGCGHSGTTLILRILSYHSDIYGINYESRIFFHYRKQKLEAFRKWERIRKLNKKTFWIEKTPKHVEKISEILHTFPKAKIIVIVRDGRDVAVSLTKRNYSLKEGMKRWVDDNKKVLKYKNNKQFHFIKLETFIKSPNETLRILCRFINIKFEKNLMEYHNEMFSFGNISNSNNKNIQEGTNHDEYRNWQINQPIFSSTLRWKDETSKQEKLLLYSNSAFNKILKEYDYEIHNFN